LKLLSILLALVVPPAIYFPTVEARHDREQRAADQQLARIEGRAQDARTAQQDPTGFQQDAAHLAQDIEQYRVTLPPTLATSDIFRLLEQSTGRNGLRLVRFAPRAPAKSGPLEIVSIEAETEGPPDGVAALLRDLGDRPQPGRRYLTFSGVTSSGTHTSFVVTAYALPDEN